MMHIGLRQEEEHNEKEQQYNKNIHFIREGSIWLSIVTCFMLFLYAPLELLFMNQDEFWWDAYLIFPLCFLSFWGHVWSVYWYLLQ